MLLSVCINGILFFLQEIYNVLFIPAVLSEVLKGPNGARELLHIGKKYPFNEDVKNYMHSLKPFDLLQFGPVISGQEIKMGAQDTVSNLPVIKNIICRDFALDKETEEKIEDSSYKKGLQKALSLIDYKKGAPDYTHFVKSIEAIGLSQLPLTEQGRTIIELYRDVKEDQMIFLKVRVYLQIM